MANSDENTLIPRTIIFKDKKYVITDVEEDDKITSQDVTTIVVTRNLEQAEKKLGKKLSDVRENLAGLDAFVKDCEDTYLGERYPLPNFNSAYSVEETYLSDGFHQAEKPSETVLELLQILASQNDTTPLQAKENDNGQVLFARTRRKLLKRVLFDNPFLGRISRSGAYKNQQDRWEEWRNVFNRSDSKQDDHITVEQCTKLASHFSGFAEFEKAINIMRSWELDHDNSRQWSTKFLFPFGLNAIYNETTVANSFKTNFLAGQGELLFSMLQRAKQNTESYQDVGAKLIDQFIIQNDAVNTLAGYINDAEKESKDIVNFHKLKEVNTTGSDEIDELHRKTFETQGIAKSLYFTAFVPYKHLKLYDNLCEDIANLLECNLSKQDLFIALSRIATLHLMTYLLEQERQICICQAESAKSKELSGSFVQFKEDSSILSLSDKNDIEEFYKIVIPTCVQDAELQNIKSLSKVRQSKNNELFNQSRRAYVLHRCEKFIELTVPFLRHKDELSTREASLVINIISAAFNYDQTSSKKNKPNYTIEWDKRNCQTIINTMVKDACQRQTHMNDIHNNMAKVIGLCKVTKGNTSRYYELSDELLRVLVMASLGHKKHMQLQEFLKRIEDRYHIVIYNAQQLNSTPRANNQTSADREEYENNLTKLKMQLHRLGMLISLSDYCEYIKNA